MLLRCCTCASKQAKDKDKKEKKEKTKDKEKEKEKEEAAPAAAEEEAAAPPAAEDEDKPSETKRDEPKKKIGNVFALFNQSQITEFKEVCLCIRLRSIFRIITKCLQCLFAVAHKLAAMSHYTHVLNVIQNE